MPVYQAKQNADTWKSYLGGILSDKTTAVPAGERIVAVDLGSVLKLADGRFTKEMWFDLIPDSPPLPSQPPTPLPITTTRYRLEWDEDNTGIVTGLKFYRNGVPTEL